MTIEPAPDEQKWFDIFRVRIWPEFFSGVQFPQDPASLDQYFNTHFPFSDLNNLEIADLMSGWLAKKGLD